MTNNPLIFRRSAPYWNRTSLKANYEFAASPIGQGPSQYYNTMFLPKEELPGQLPPSGKVYQGTVTIPTALVENSKELTMSLTDYPDQKMQLQMSGIPVAQ